MKKTWFWWGTAVIFVLTAVIVVIPGLLVDKMESAEEIPDVPVIRTKPTVPLEIQERAVNVPVYLTKERRIETVPLESYVRGVVAGEMPANFEPEALKAQAIAARTYIVRRMMEHDFSNVPVKGAWVTDAVDHQAYVSEQDLKKKWNFIEYGRNMDKINEAVNETKDLIITYEGKPIVPAFFSTSNGYTENSEDYWGEYVPYLRSVPSPWDKNLSPRYKETVTIDYLSALRKLGVDRAAGAGAGFTVMATTAGHRIKKLKIGDKTFTGREVREKLGLHSTQFVWQVQGNELKVTTFGFGHGVGMSQWGANGMAKQGKTAEDILKYYYRGVRIEKASKIADGAKAE